MYKIYAKLAVTGSDIPGMVFFFSTLLSFFFCCIFFSNKTCTILGVNSDMHSFVLSPAICCLSMSGDVGV